MPFDIAIIHQRSPTAGSEADHDPEAIRTYLNTKFAEILTARGHTLVAVISRSIDHNHVHGQRIHVIDYQYS